MERVRLSGGFRHYICRNCRCRIVVGIPDVRVDKGKIMQACRTVYSCKQCRSLAAGIHFLIDEQPGDRISLPVKFARKIFRLIGFFISRSLQVSDHRKRLQSRSRCSPCLCIAIVQNDIRAETHGFSFEISLLNSFCRAVYNRRKTCEVGTVGQGKNGIGRVVP